MDEADISANFMPNAKSILYRECRLWPQTG
jgi:hypothetical protein